MQDFLVIEDVGKSFGDVRAVDAVTLGIKRGEVFSLLGPSGCGKTTLLRLLAGFEKPDRGRIVLGGKDITALPPERRPVNTVFQNYALFPHLSVRENIAFGLRMARRVKAEIDESVRRMLALVQLDEHAHKKPAQLSGGQRQRVAIARALVNGPQVLLLDEPLAALDLKLRQHMLAELQAIHHQVGTTFVYVTHDQGEAMSLSHRIAVMNAGKVEQLDAPAALYERPRTSFVASFIGDANFLKGVVEELLPHGYVRITVEGFGAPLVMGRPGLSCGQGVRIMIRPERIILSHVRPGSHERVNVLQGIIEDSAYFGPHTRHRLHTGGLRLVIQRQQAAQETAGAFAVGSTVWASFHPDDGLVVDQI